MFVLPRHRTLDQVQAALERHLLQSRFTCRFDRELTYGNRGRNNLFALRLRMVRLQTRKSFCGAHPGPCPVHPAFERPKRNYAILEAADWVAWDDFLNDVCDRYRFEADIWSISIEHNGPFFIRRGRARRTNHPADWVDTFGVVRMVWSRDPGERRAGWSEDHFGVRRDAPRAAYPEDTPGIPEWRRSREKKALARHDHHG